MIRFSMKFSVLTLLSYCRGASTPSDEEPFGKTDRVSLLDVVLDNSGRVSFNGLLFVDSFDCRSSVLRFSVTPFLSTPPWNSWLTLEFLAPSPLRIEYCDVNPVEPLSGLFKTWENRFVLGVYPPTSLFSTNHSCGIFRQQKTILRT